MLTVGGQKVYANVAKVMLGICVMFHSNADCERIFSLVTKNKTQYRPTLSTDMLSSLVTHKTVMVARNEVCYQTYSGGWLIKAKSATYEG